LADGDNRCPFCSGYKLSSTNRLTVLYPEVSAQWHPTKNGDLTAADVTYGATKKYWWKCGKGPDHEWPASPSKRTVSKRGCPFCSGRKVSTTNSLASGYPKIAAQWHPTKNKSLRPEQFTSGSSKRVWWQCSNNPMSGEPRLLGELTLNEIAPSVI
tara:strand:+ start:131 stop:598 length:468 start_codon:yes stop_codon:yes gene_type:complete